MEQLVQRTTNKLRDVYASLVSTPFGQKGGREGCCCLPVMGQVSLFCIALLTERKFNMMSLAFFVWIVRQHCQLTAALHFLIIFYIPDTLSKYFYRYIWFVRPGFGSGKKVSLCEKLSEASSMSSKVNASQLQPDPQLVKTRPIRNDSISVITYLGRKIEIVVQM